MEWFQFTGTEIVAWDFQCDRWSSVLQKYRNVSLSYHILHYLHFRELFLFENRDESGVELVFLYLIQIALVFLQSFKVKPSQRFGFPLETKAQAELFNHSHMRKGKKEKGAT